MDYNPQESQIELNRINTMGMPTTRTLVRGTLIVRPRPFLQIWIKLFNPTQNPQVGCIKTTQVVNQHTELEGHPEKTQRNRIPTGGYTPGFRIHNWRCRGIEKERVCDFGGVLQFSWIKPLLMGLVIQNRGIFCFF